MATHAQDEYRTGTLTAADAVLECALPAFATAAVQLTGTFTATVVFEVNNNQGDSPTWEATNALDVNDGSIVSSATAPGLFRVDVSGVREFRIRCSAYTSGTIQVDINGSVAPSSQALVSGVTLDAQGLQVSASTEYTEGDTDATFTGGIVMWEDAADTAVTVSASTPLPVAPTSVIPGTGATNLGKAEDAVHASGDTGVMALAVRKDTAAALSADGDYIPLITDSTGNLRTTGDASAAFADVNATLATAVTKEQRVVADILVADAGGNAMNRVRCAKDAISGVGGGAMLAAGVCGLDSATFRPLKVDSSGQLVPGTGATNLGKAEDAAHTTGDTGVMALAVRNDTQATLAGTDGDYAPLQVGPNGSLRTVAAGYTTIVDATLTRPANTTAYAAGDEVADTGGSVITLTGMARFSGGSGIIQSVLIAVSSNWATKPSLELWLYDTTNAPATDNSAFDPTDGENDTLVAVIPVSTTYVGDATASTGNFAMSSGIIGIPFKCSGSANLFMRIVIRNAGQAGANSDTLKFRFKVLQD